MPVSGTLSANTVTVNLAASAKASITVGEYSGVASISGSLTATNTATSTAPSVALTIQDANDLVIAGINGNGTATL